MEQPLNTFNEAPQVKCDVWCLRNNAMLGALLVLNIVLVYRLLLLEHATQSRIYWDGNLDELPTEAEEWAKLLQQQRNMQAIEIKRWRDVLTSSIQLMSQVQQSLDALQKELGKEQRAATESTT